MRREDNLQPFLVAFPLEDGGHQVMLDPGFFQGGDEVGSFLATLARQFARGFVQSGRARDMADALEQIREMFLFDLHAADDGEDEPAA